MKEYDGNKLTKNEIKARLNKIGVHYDKNNNSKQYYIELYNKASSVQDNRIKLNYQSNSDTQSSFPSRINQNNETNSNSHHQNHQRKKKGGITLSLIKFALVLAFIVSLIQAQRLNKFQILEEFPTINNYIHQMNPPVKRALLPIINFIIKAIKPYVPYRFTATLIHTEKEIANDLILVILPVITFLPIFFILLLYCLLRKKEKNI